MIVSGMETPRYLWGRRLVADLRHWAPWL